MPMEDITVRLFGRNKEIAVFTEGNGANFIRQQGKSGDYMVNINGRHLGLSEGSYTILVEFDNNGERVVYSIPIMLK